MKKPVAAFDFLGGIADDAPFKEISLLRDSRGGMNIRASYGDAQLGMKPLSERDAKIFAALTDPSEKELFKKSVCAKTFAEEINAIKAPAVKQHQLAF